MHVVGKMKFSVSFIYISACFKNHIIWPAWCLFFRTDPPTPPAPITPSLSTGIDEYCQNTNKSSSQRTYEERLLVVLSILELQLRTFSTCSTMYNTHTT